MEIYKLDRDFSCRALLNPEIITSQELSELSSNLTLSQILIESKSFVLEPDLLDCHFLGMINPTGFIIRQSIFEGLILDLYLGIEALPVATIYDDGPYLCLNSTNVLDVRDQEKLKLDFGLLPTKKAPNRTIRINPNSELLHHNEFFRIYENSPLYYARDTSSSEPNFIDLYKGNNWTGIEIKFICDSENW